MQDQNTRPVYEARLFYDDGDNPVARIGASDQFATLDQARAWARGQLAGHESGWYVAIERGHMIDPIGDGLEYDFTFDADPEFSEIVHAGQP